jgi:hypothetical protein
MTYKFKVTDYIIKILITCLVMCLFDVYYERPIYLIINFFIAIVGHSLIEYFKFIFCKGFNFFKKPKQ